VSGLVPEMHLALFLFSVMLNPGLNLFQTCFSIKVTTAFLVLDYYEITDIISKIIEWFLRNFAVMQQLKRRFYEIINAYSVFVSLK
jgi:hypothetical protein